MTLSAPLGCISMAEERLRDMLAASTTMQAWLHVSGPAAAKERIHLVELPPSMNANDGEDGNYPLAEITQRRPFAIVWTPPDQPFQIDIVASPAFSNQSGVLRVRLEENVPDQYADNYVEAYRQFLNHVGRIIQSNEPHNPGLVELLAVPQPGHLAFRSISVIEHQRTSSDDVPTQGDAHKCELEIRWGADV